MSVIRNRSIRTVLGWQCYATVAIAALMMFWKGNHGGISALLGGLVSIVAGAAYGYMVSRKNVRSAGNTLRILLRAESTKIALTVLQLWFVLTMYKNIDVVGFFLAFIATVMIFSLALFVSDK